MDQTTVKNANASYQTYEARYFKSKNYRGTISLTDTQLLFHSNDTKISLTIDYHEITKVRKRTLLAQILLIIFFPIILLFFLIVILNSFKGNHSTIYLSKNFYVYDKNKNKYKFASRSKGNIIRTLKKNIGLLIL